MKKVAIYIRVSTNEQAVEGFSIQAQKERLKNYCDAKEWKLISEYVDPGYTGSNLDRPAMKRLIEDIHNFDIVLVYKLDRLSRSQKDTLYLIEDVFLKNNVDFVSMNESFDTTTAFGRAMIGILSVFAQLERENIRERSIMGQVEREKSGLFHGGPFIPIGYDYINGQLIINEYEALQIKEIFKLYLQDNGINKISKSMQRKYKNKYGDWSYSSTIADVLDNSVYCGRIKEYEGQHESIISVEDFEMVKDKRSKFIRQSQKYNSLLGGFIFCGNCGARYGVQHNTYYKDNNYKYYACYSRSKKAKHMIVDPSCKNQNMNCIEFDNIIKNRIFDLNYKRDIENLSIEYNVNPNAVIETRIKEIDMQIERVIDLYQLGKTPLNALNNRLDKLNSERSMLQSQIIEYQEKDFSIMEELLKDSRKIFETGNLAEQRKFIGIFIEKIIIYPNNYTIKWTFPNLEC
ncbi:MAG TPA: recombinase family protein [Methanosarcinales archaeon]|nr:recombinase family protein [Methanosarcinales archaeon]